MPTQDFAALDQWKDSSDPAAFPPNPAVGDRARSAKRLAKTQSMGRAIRPVQRDDPAPPEGASKSIADCRLDQAMRSAVNLTPSPCHSFQSIADIS
jgi:hypothetical protein